MVNARSVFLMLALGIFSGAVGCRSGSKSTPPSSIDNPAAAPKPANDGAAANGRELRLVLPFPSYPENPSAPPSKTFGEGYEFTEDWFTRNVPVWASSLEPFKGKPRLRYLEVGTFEGMSALWMLQNVLVHESSTAEGVDPYFDESTKARALKNLEHSGHATRFKLHRGLSADILPKLEPASYDLIYIDGSHTADDVLADAVLCWLLLKPAGLLIFDDWQFNTSLPDELRPAVAIDAFLTAYRRRLDIVHRGYQVIVRKAGDDVCGTHPFCTQLGEYHYNYQDRGLRDAAGRPMPLTEDERLLVEQLLTSRRFGAGRDEWLGLDLARLDPTALKALASRLRLRLP